MAGNSDAAKGSRGWDVSAGAAVAAAVLLYFFPLFHVERLNGRATSGALGEPVTAASFDAAAAATRLWRAKLQPAAASAPDVAAIAAEIRANPAAAVHRHGHEVGIGGTAYLFVRGRGRITARTPDAVRVVLEGAPPESVDLVVGPVFGNTVRDGTALLNVNDFPGLEEFNALAAELNHQVETTVEPVLRRAPVGAEVEFAGCAEAPDSVAAGAPLLTIVPITAIVVNRVNLESQPR